MISCTPEKSKKLDKSFFLKGNIQGTVSERVYLLRLENDNFKIIDSSEINKGKFFFRDSSLRSPEMLFLDFRKDKSRINFFAESSEINIHADFIKSKNFIVTGSQTHNEFLKFKQNITVFTNKLNDLSKQKQVALENNDTLSLLGLDSLLFSVKSEQTDFMKNYVVQNKNSHISLFISVLYLSKLLDYKELFSIYLNFPDSLEVSPYFFMLQKIIESQKKLENGKKAPDFSLPDLNNNKISLEMFTGKKTLICFWKPYSDPDLKYIKQYSDIFSKMTNKKNRLVFISLDNDINNLNSLISTNKISGVHLYAENDSVFNSLIKDYDLKVGKKNILIDETGYILKIGISPIEYEKLFD